MDKGRSGLNANDWDKIHGRSHLKHPKLTRDQLEYTILQMRTRSPHRNLTTTLSIDSEVDALFPSSNNEVELTLINDEPPINKSPPENDTKIVLKYNNAIVAALCTLIAFPFLVPSTSKFLRDLGLMTFSKDMNIEDQVGDPDNQDQGIHASQDFQDVDVNRNFESSSSDIRSADEKVVDPFTLLEI
ncbi:unnamed protein product [Lactuca saligna]|uniref:Uncharacterized protein n=1 Tax=Lactuca saligna TaxID=75948 RepID=A0AA35V3U1_LACSI|nr:unnamed protein product [Lactuca saligna]